MPRSEQNSYQPLWDRDELQALKEVFDGGNLSLFRGNFTSELEQAFGTAHEGRFAVALNSGTAALHLSLAALGVGPGHEVIVPAVI